MDANIVMAGNLAMDRGIAIVKLLEDLDEDTRRAAMGIAESLLQLNYMKSQQGCAEPK